MERIFTVLQICKSILSMHFVISDSNRKRYGKNLRIRNKVLRISLLKGRGNIDNAIFLSSIIQSRCYHSVRNKR